MQETLSRQETLKSCRGREWGEAFHAETDSAGEEQSDASVKQERTDLHDQDRAFPGFPTFNVITSRKSLRERLTQFLQFTVMHTPPKIDKARPSIQMAQLLLFAACPYNLILAPIVQY